ARVPLAAKAVDARRAVARPRTADHARGVPRRHRAEPEGRHCRARRRAERGDRTRRSTARVRARDGTRRSRGERRRAAVQRCGEDRLPRLLMATFCQTVVSGLAQGSIYGSLALALVLIYKATDVINFAQGEMAMFTTYIAWALMGHATATFS